MEKLVSENKSGFAQVSNQVQDNESSKNIEDSIIEDSIIEDSITEKDLIEKKLKECRRSEDLIENFPVAYNPGRGILICQECIPDPENFSFSPQMLCSGVFWYESEGEYSDEDGDKDHYEKKLFHEHSGI